jgi:membrane-bound lytic murein transglycosylase A
MRAAASAVPRAATGVEPCATARAALLVPAMLLLAACVSAPRPAPPERPPLLRLLPTSWEALPGWQSDDLTAAWPALRASCNSARLASVWAPFCAEAGAIDALDAPAQRLLLESRLRPWQIVLEAQDRRATRQSEGLITGYYEPVLNGARTRGGAYQTPLYGVPDDLVTVELGALYPALQGERIRGRLQGRRVTPYPDRAQLADGSVLAGKEIVWVDDPVDAFFLQIQGSGRVRLTDGTVIRLAFADVNGQPYRAIGRTLVEQGVMTVEEATAPGIRQWLAANPQRRDEILNSNPSVVFFRELPLGEPALGPSGSLGVPLTAQRSLAIDPRLLPLGAPLYLATTHPLDGTPLQQLMLAQDTGGAIRGALRADLFFGLGPAAGEAAGRMRQQGAMWLLWPLTEVPPGALP